MSAALVILPAVWARAASERSKILPKVGEVKARRAAPQVAFYRKYTEGILRRYVRLSMEAGRAPSLLGREMFRGKVTSYRVHSFEDVVIFVHDVESCLGRLNEEQRHLVRRIGLQEFTQAETAALLRMSLRSVHRLYADALDELTELFLERKLLEPSKACEEGGKVF